MATETVEIHVGFCEDQNKNKTLIVALFEIDDVQFTALTVVEREDYIDEEYDKGASWIGITALGTAGKLLFQNKDILHGFRFVIHVDEITYSKQWPDVKGMECCYNSCSPDPPRFILGLFSAIILTRHLESYDYQILQSSSFSPKAMEIAQKLSSRLI